MATKQQRNTLLHQSHHRSPAHRLFLGMALMAGVFPPVLVGLVAPGFAPGTGALTATLTRSALASVVFVGMGEVVSQLLFAYGRFVLPGLVGSVDHLVVILVLLALFALQLPLLWDKRRFFVRPP